MVVICPGNCRSGQLPRAAGCLSTHALTFCFERSVTVWTGVRSELLFKVRRVSLIELQTRRSGTLKIKGANKI